MYFIHKPLHTNIDINVAPSEYSNVHVWASIEAATQDTGKNISLAFSIFSTVLAISSLTVYSNISL